MKFRSKHIAVIAALAILVWLAVSAPVALAQTPVVLTGFSVTDINIRSSPGTSAGSVGILPAREKVSAVGRNSSNNWVQIQYGTTVGWVAAWLTVYSGDTALLPIASTAEPEPLGGPGPFDLTSPFNVNVRAEPNVKAGLLTTIPFDDHAQAFGRTAGSSWVNIRYQGHTGWVAAWLVILSNDINALPVTSGEEVPPGSPPSGPTPTAPNGTPSTPGTATPPDSPPVLPPEGGISVLTPGRANIRSAPSTTAAIIGAITYTATATAVGRNASHNWLQVIHNGTQGWVARWVVVTSDDTFTLPVTSESAEILPIPGGAGITGKSIYEVIIHSGPGLTYGTLAALPPYTSVPLIARTESNNWLKVSYQNTEGWVAAWLIAASGDYANLPVEPSAQ